MTTQLILLGRAQTTQTKSEAAAEIPRSRTTQPSFTTQWLAMLVKLVIKNRLSPLGRQEDKACTSEGLLLTVTLVTWYLFLLCQAGMVFILTEVIYLSRVITLLRLLSVFSYILSVFYCSQDLCLISWRRHHVCQIKLYSYVKIRTPPPNCGPT